MVVTHSHIYTRVIWNLLPRATCIVERVPHAGLGAKSKATNASCMHLASNHSPWSEDESLILGNIIAGRWALNICKLDPAFFLQHLHSQHRPVATGLEVQHSGISPHLDECQGVVPTRREAPATNFLIPRAIEVLQTGDEVWPGGRFKELLCYLEPA